MNLYGQSEIRRENARIKELETAIKKLKGFVTKVRSESNKRATFGLMDDYFRMMADDCTRILND